MNSLSPELIEALGLTVMDALWQGALILLVALLFVSFFKKSSSRLKYRFLVGAMFLMPVWSVISFNQHYQVPVTLDIPEVQSELPPVTGNIEIGDFQALETTPVELGFMDKIIAWTEANADVAAYIWLLGVLVFGVRLFGGLVYVRYIRRTSVQIDQISWLTRLSEISAEFGIKAEVGLRESVRVSSPIVMGFLKPIVIFPIGLIEGLPTDQVEAILAHELAHLKRWDYLMNLILSALQVVYFFHPAYWWLYRQAEQEREFHCDQLAINHIGSKVTLIKALTAVQELKQQGLVPAMAFARRKNQLLERITRIAEGRQRTNWLSGLVSLFLIMLTFALMSWQIPAEELSQQGTTETELTIDSFLGIDSDSIEMVSKGESLGKHKLTIDRDPSSKGTIPTPETGINDTTKKKNQMWTYTYREPGELATTPGRKQGSIVKPITDSIPVDQRKVYAIMNEMYQYFQNKLKQLDASSLSSRSERLINDLEQIEKTDSARMIDTWKLAIESFSNDLTQEIKEKELDLELKQTKLESLESELRDTQNKFDEGFERFDEFTLEEAQRELVRLETELAAFPNTELSPEEEQVYLELKETLENSRIKYERKVDMFKKNQAKFGNSRPPAAPKKWSGLKIDEPISRTVYDQDYEVIKFNVTDRDLRQRDYEFEFTEADLKDALLILDDEILGENGLETLNKIGITNLGVVQNITGHIAMTLFPEEMETRSSVVRVMTKAYAASPRGQAKMDMMSSIIKRVPRSFFGATPSAIYFGHDTYKILLNNEVIDGLVPTKLFDRYGKRYTSYLSIPRKLALPIYGRDFLGDAQGIFFPFIDGKNSSVPDFYAKLDEFKLKLDQPGFVKPDVAMLVEHHLKKREDSELLKNQLRTEAFGVDNDFIIVLNGYVRKDLTLEDLTRMDLTSVTLLKGNDAKALYAKFMGDKNNVLKVSSGSSGGIEYSNSMDPRSLKENEDVYKLPPYQSEIEAFDKALETALLKDNKIEAGEEVTVFLEADKMLINFEVQPKRVLKRYHKLYEKTMGFPLNKDISYYFNK